ncbi:N-acetyltransferase, partial [Pseudomonas soli]|nr:N-acetyltransferase [Pseudomonas soli]
GFEPIPAARLDARLRAILASELAHGLDQRCAMRLPIDA